MKAHPQPVLVDGHVQFNARMRADLHRGLKVYSVATGRSMQECVSEAIAEFLRVHADPEGVPYDD